MSEPPKRSSAAVPPGFQRSVGNASGLSALPKQWPLDQLRRNALGLLQAAGVEDPAGDIRALFTGLLGISAADQIARRDMLLDSQEMRVFRTGLERRLNTREPVSRILGVRGFWTFDVRLSPDVLDPRPETEILVDAILSRHEGAGNAPTGAHTIVDFGTGSGCLITALLLEFPEAKGIATDTSEAALAIARQTAEDQRVEDRLSLHQTSWGEGVAGPVDAIVCNPPYVRDDELESLAPEVRDFDPPQALLAGADGLAAYRALTPHAARLLRPGGTLALEIGQGQRAAVTDILRSHGLDVVETLSDLAGIERCLVATPSIRA